MIRNVGICRRPPSRIDWRSLPQRNVVSTLRLPSTQRSLARTSPPTGPPRREARGFIQFPGGITCQVQQCRGCAEVTRWHVQHIKRDGCRQSCEGRYAATPVLEKKARNTFLLSAFSVKLEIAKDFVPLGSSPSSKLDTFVALSDEAGARLAKTRTIYETLSPRCMPFLFSDDYI